MNDHSPVRTLVERAFVAGESGLGAIIHNDHAALRAEADALDAQVRVGAWQPVADGEYDSGSPNSWIRIEGRKVTFRDGKNELYVKFTPEYAICERRSGPVWPQGDAAAQQLARAWHDHKAEIADTWSYDNLPESMKAPRREFAAAVLARLNEPPHE